MRVGAHVRALRLARGMTQRQLAERTGVRGFYKQHITRIEKGHHLVGLELLSGVARALDVEVSELLTCLDGMRPHAPIAEAAE